jgi:N-methylhydantoinase A
MLFADFRYDLTETVVSLLDAADLKEIDGRFRQLEAAGEKQIKQMEIPIQSIRYIRYAEMRYRRQEHTIKIRLPEKAFDRKELAHLFEDTYKHRFGHASNMEIEIVMLRLVIEGRTVRPELAKPANGKAGPAKASPRRIWFEETGFVECDAWQRTELVPGQVIEGPGVIEEEASTTVLTPGDRASLDNMGNIVITLGSRS